MSDVKTQADVTDVRPLDLEAARIAVKPIVDAELQAERPVGCLRCIELQRDISALQSRCEAAEASVARLTKMNANLSDRLAERRLAVDSAAIDTAIKDAGETA